MKNVYFFHSLLDENIQNISRSINVYFSKTNYSLMINDKFSYYAYKRQGLRFYWRVDPIELNYEDLGLQSEVILKGQTIKKKEITEIRISFTDFLFLELYFERLVYNLLNQYEIINGTRQIPCLKGELRFTSLYDYNLYRMKRDRDAKEELDRAFSQNNFEESQSTSNVGLEKLPQSKATELNKKKHRIGRKALLNETQQLDLVREWDQRDTEDIILIDFLIKKYGATNGYPVISRATFYSYKRRLIQKGLYKPQAK